MNFISSKAIVKEVYHVVVVIMVYIGGIEQNFFVWSLADFGLGIMTVINILCIIPISGEALNELKKYEIKLKSKKRA